MNILSITLKFLLKSLAIVSLNSACSALVYQPDVSKLKEKIYNSEDYGTSK